MNIIEFNRVTGRFQGFKKILIYAVATVTLCKDKDTGHYGIREFNHIKKYRDCFGVIVTGHYAPNQLKDDTPEKIKPQSGIYRGCVGSVDNISEHIQSVSSDI